MAISTNKALFLRKGFNRLILDWCGAPDAMFCIGNAVKHHTGSRPHVWVTVRDKEKFYEFSVADDGRGIAPQYHQKIFMMFQTLTPSDMGNDSGIGLALVKKIVEEAGGGVLEPSDRVASIRF